ncbi:phosphoglycerate kinase [Candidatus Woesearchaeota archaeon]|nr:phosphoglycerate kinase [Candidatus Woesearchaeota archaeon]
MADYKTIEEVDVKGKCVLARLDLNVPMKEGKIKDYTRIDAALPTIKYLSDNGAKVVLMSHFGRPEGKIVAELSLKPVAVALGEKLGKEVKLAPDCIGDEVEALVNGMADGDVILLENLRFHPGEEANEAGFVESLAKLADVYVNDAFGTAHRAHASTAGVPLHLLQQGKEVAAGYLMKEELEIWGEVVASEGKKVLVIGGKKLKEKMKAIKKLAKKVSLVVVGGVPYSVIQKAAGMNIGGSLAEEKGKDYAEEAKEILEKCSNLILGEQVVVAKPDTWEDQKTLSIKDGVSDGYAIADIIISEDVKSSISSCDFAIIFGPLGIFEKGFTKGTGELAAAISANQNIKVVVGGGDSALAYKGVPNMKVSTGGGASISYLKDGTLDALEALKGNAEHFKKE